jgi:membrane-bound inhibitor of C-type lysozyme
LENGWARVEIKNMQKKVLIVDTSGIDPISYSISTKQLQLNLVHSFLNYAGITLKTSYKCATKEFTYEYNRQGDLLVESISEDSKTCVNIGVVYMSYNGGFSTTWNGLGCVKIDVIDSSALEISTTNCQTLWKTSIQWQNEMSQVDKSLINVAELIQTENRAILSNDYQVRVQCQNDGIKAYGTCSLLAGMTLANVISFQKGTSIYSNWVNKDRKWVPKNRITKETITFKEILDIEKERIKNGLSFWINQ